jgi:DNA-binding IscR family transcriptional regulator
VACTIRHLWHSVQQAVDHVLGETTLEDLLPKDPRDGFPPATPVRLTEIRLS